MNGEKKQEEGLVAKLKLGILKEENIKKFRPSMQRNVKKKTKKVSYKFRGTKLQDSKKESLDLGIGSIKEVQEYTGTKEGSLFKTYVLEC